MRVWARANNARILAVLMQPVHLLRSRVSGLGFGIEGSRLRVWGHRFDNWVPLERSHTTESPIVAGIRACALGWRVEDSG